MRAIAEHRVEGFPKVKAICVEHDIAEKETGRGRARDIAEKETGRGRARDIAEKEITGTWSPFLGKFNTGIFDSSPALCFNHGQFIGFGIGESVGVATDLHVEGGPSMRICTWREAEKMNGPISDERIMLAASDWDTAPPNRAKTGLAGLGSVGRSCTFFCDCYFFGFDIGESVGVAMELRLGDDLSVSVSERVQHERLSGVRPQPVHLRPRRPQIILPDTAEQTFLVPDFFEFLI